MHPTLTRHARRRLLQSRESMLVRASRHMARLLMAVAILISVSVLLERAAPTGHRPSEFLRAAARL